MADNVQITPGTGNVIGADEVTDGTLGVVKIQYVKLMDGTINGVNKATVSSGGAVLIDGSATVQPVSGTFFPATQPVSAVALPLPSGASTEATLSTLNGKVTAVNTGAVTISTALPAGSAVIGHVINDASSAVIGHVINDTGSTTAVTGNVTVVQPTGTNLHVVVDTAPSTAVTGTVTVTQATGTNLHAVLDATSTTAVTQATGTNLHTVVDSGTITTVTTLTGITNALPAGTNVIGVTGVAQASTTAGQSGELVQGAVTTNAPAYTTAKTSPLSLTTAGFLRVSPTQALGTTSASLSNSTNTQFFIDSSGDVASTWVVNSLSGGSFSGTADTARQGITVGRTATVFRTVSATASGNTAVWTAATGNKWRLLRYRIMVTNNASNAGGVNTIKFQDVTTDIAITHDVYIPAVALTSGIGDGYDSGWVDLGLFGIIAAATATALNINLSTTLSTGNVRVMVAGTEE